MLIVPPGAPKKPQIKKITEFTHAEIEEAIEKMRKVTRAYWNVASKKWGRAMLPQFRHKGFPELVFDTTPKMGTGKKITAGTASYINNSSRDRIKYNMELALSSQHNFLETINDTVPHEVAHLWGLYVSGSMDHNTPWKNVMRSLGKEKATAKFVQVNGQMMDPRLVRRHIRGD
jgi:hypothetical protein